MAKRRPSGDGMVRKRDDGRWEGRIVVGHKENGGHTVSCFRFESMDFAFALNNQSNGNRLYTSCRKRRFHFSPKYRRQFKTYDTVQNTSCLLCIHEVNVNITWLFDCF